MWQFNFNRFGAVQRERPVVLFGDRVDWDGVDAIAADQNHNRTDAADQADLQQDQVGSTSVASARRWACPRASHHHMDGTRISPRQVVCTSQRWLVGADG
jgi:hypothetical protein